MDARFEPSGVDEDGEISGGEHQVEVGWVPDPAVGAGEGQLQVEVDLEIVGNVVVVQEEGLNLRNKYCSCTRAHS